MKRFLLTLIALGFAGNLMAAQYGLAGTFLAGGTQHVKGASTSNYTSSLVLTKYDDVALYINFSQYNAAQGSNVVFTFERSVDNSTWESTQKLPITLVETGNTAVCLVTNVTVGAYGYWRLSSIQNTCTNVVAAVTNITVKVYAKPKRFGK